MSVLGVYSVVSNVKPGGRVPTRRLPFKAVIRAFTASTQGWSFITGSAHASRTTPAIPGSHKFHGQGVDTGVRSQRPVCRLCRLHAVRQCRVLPVPFPRG